MSHEIFSTSTIWEYLTSEENLKYLRELNELEEDEEISMDSLNFDYQDSITYELEYLSESLKKFVKRYEKRYKTTIANIVFLGTRSSRYGSIGGSGRIVGREVGTTNLADMDLDYDDIDFSITEENELVLVASDHDGQNYMTMVLVTETEQNKADEEYADIREILHEKGKASTKLDNQFKLDFGLSNKSKVSA